MGFFDKDSLWKHRNLGFLVRISHISEDGLFTLCFADLEEDALAKGMLSGRWAAVDLARDFSPQIAASKWDRLLDDDSPLSEE